ncbi:MAG: hypothetical protein ACXW6V_16505 [Candidatus Binatia bacterium]
MNYKLSQMSDEELLAEIERMNAKCGHRCIEPALICASVRIAGGRPRRRKLQP